MNTNQCLSGFLQRAGDIKNYAWRPVEETEFFCDLDAHSLCLTQFHDIYDTLFYSRLIKKAIHYAEGVTELYDLGAGSSIPTLLALPDNAYSISAIAVDLDPVALEISKFNALKYGFYDRYRFVEGSLSDILQEIQLKRTLIVSNPPYIPVPQHVTGHHFLPVNGGADGSRHIMDILEREYVPGTVLALLWGSLCHPDKIINKMAEYKILEVDAFQIHFGNYTSDPRIKKYLYELREEGTISFDITPKGEVQTVIGTILSV